MDVAVNIYIFLFQDFVFLTAHHSTSVAVHCNIPLSATFNSPIFNHVAFVKTVFETFYQTRVTNWQILTSVTSLTNEVQEIEQTQTFNKIKNIESQKYNKPNKAELAALMIAQK